MINVVLFEPEIPENTGNIMRTCAGTLVHLHLIRPLGFALNDGIIRRSAVNYMDKVKYTLYDDFDDFCSKNPGEYYFLRDMARNRIRKLILVIGVRIYI